jgi:phosphoenolpyruvate---glycerone phosphotransferase subunit DhaK
VQKLLNDPAAFVDETLEGILLAHPNRLRAIEGEPRAVVRADAPVQGKVGIATGGGSGHLPVFLGYVGSGLVDGCAVGQLFASPNADQMLAVTRAVNSGHGVLHLYGNYSGDRMNFDFAGEMAAAEDIQVEAVRATDDVASAPPERAAQRRGIAGIFFAYKAAGACAQAGGSLGEVKAAAGHAVANTRSMGVALAPCTLPTVGRPTFDVPEDQMEIGMGIHGEPGVGRGPLRSADEVATDLVERILADLQPVDGAEVAVLVNGLGATPREELYILYRRVHSVLHQRRIAIHRAFVGEYATSLEMAGASVSLLLLDEQLKALLDAPASSPLFDLL